MYYISKYRYRSLDLDVSVDRTSMKNADYLNLTLKKDSAKHHAPTKYIEKQPCVTELHLNILFTNSHHSLLERHRY